MRMWQKEICNMSNRQNFNSPAIKSRYKLVHKKQVFVQQKYKKMIQFQKNTIENGQ